MKRQRQRWDHGTLGEVEATPQGGLAIPAFLTRSGVFDYEQADGSVIREYRPPDEVFNADSLSTLPNATMTNEHPDGRGSGGDHVHPGNFKKLVVGHVEAGSVKQANDKIAARLIIQDAKTIADIKAKRKRELSCGYHCDVDETPGVTANGERYDQIQRNIRYNHVALVPDGRAGPQVRLRLDATGNQQGSQTVDYETIRGTRYEVGSEAHAAAARARTDRQRKRADARAKQQAERGKLKARLDAAEAAVKQMQEQYATATSAERLDHAVRVRAAVVKRASVVLGPKFKYDGLSNQAIKVAAVQKANPKLRIDKRMPPAELRGYINGMFRMIPAQEQTRRGDALHSNSRNSFLRQDERTKRLDGDRLPPDLRDPPADYRDPEGRGGGGRSLAQIRADRMDEEEARHRRPLTISKANPHREMDGFPSVQSSMLETMR
jgi:uncharacterized protein